LPRHRRDLRDGRGRGAGVGRLVIRLRVAMTVGNASLVRAAA
jgi:hypothetical protein